MGRVGRVMHGLCYADGKYRGVGQMIELEEKESNCGDNKPSRVSMMYDCFE